MARRIKGEIKRRETDPASNQSLSVLHSAEQTKRFTGLDRKEKGEGGDRGNMVEKKESKAGESNPASNLTSK